LRLKLRALNSKEGKGCSVMVNSKDRGEENKLLKCRGEITEKPSCRSICRGDRKPMSGRVVREKSFALGMKRGEQGHRKDGGEGRTWIAAQEKKTRDQSCRKKSSTDRALPGKGDFTKGKYTYPSK